MPVDGACACPTTFIQSGNTCVCPQTLILNPAGTSCVSCSIQYCATCISTTSTIVCQTCSAPFISDGNGGCQCPSTFVVVDGTCGCQTNYTESAGTCYSCSPQYCRLCTGTNYCSSCINNLVAVNGVCQCADSSFNITNS